MLLRHTLLLGMLGCADKAGTAQALDTGPMEDIGETGCVPAAEVCDDLDNDCDGEVDEGLVTVVYADVDGDGYGDPTSAIETCAPLTGHVEDATDCDDTDAHSHPGASEICDGADNDCDGDNSDAGLATFFPDAGGSAVDWSALLGKDGAAATIEEAGALWLCAGEWSVSLTAVADASIIGQGALGEVNLNGMDGEPIISAEGIGSLSVRNVHLSAGAPALSLDTVASASLSDCMVTGSGSYGRDRAIKSVDSDLTISGTAFSNNLAINGAVYVEGGSLTATDSSFSDGDGDMATANALYAEDAVVSLSDVRFTGHRYGRAVWIRGSTLTVERATFSDNHSSGESCDPGDAESDSGAALALEDTDAIIVDSTFSGNRAICSTSMQDDVAEGGALSVRGGAVTVTDSVFTGNTVHADTELGGAILSAGEVHLKDCAVWDNTANSGGGVFVESGTMTIEGGSYYRNDASTLVGLGGGGAYVEGGTLSVSGSDWGSDKDDNSDGDVRTADGGDYSYGAGATFTCTASGCQ